MAGKCFILGLVEKFSKFSLKKKKNLIFILNGGKINFKKKFFFVVKKF